MEMEDEEGPITPIFHLWIKDPPTNRLGTSPSSPPPNESESEGEVMTRWLKVAIDGLEKNLYVDLDLSNRNISNARANHLAIALKKNTSLKKLNLMVTNLSTVSLFAIFFFFFTFILAPISLKPICQALFEHPKLEIFDLVRSAFIFFFSHRFRDVIMLEVTVVLHYLPFLPKPPR